MGGTGQVVLSTDFVNSENTAKRKKIKMTE